MATLDEILGGSPPDDGGNAPKGSQAWAEQNSGENAGNNGGTPPPKGSQAWAEQNSGENAPVSSPATVKPKEQPKPTAGGGGASGGGGGGYEDLFKKLNPYTPPTAEELEKQKKKQKRAQIFAAIGDGVAALSNLYFATQYAPSMYDGKNTITGTNKVRYDKLMKDQEERTNAYINGLTKARQADEAAAERSRAAAERERAWQRQLGLDQEARDRYKESIKHRNEREKLADDRYNQEQADKKARTEEENRRWQATFDEDKRRSDRSHDFQVKQHDDNVAVRRETAAATRAKGVRGKQLGFADGNGNQVSIYENVWKGSMQQVYDVLYADMVDAYKKDKENNPRVPRHKTQSEKEDFVKQNWHKSAKASQIMLTLSGIDPATMTSELNEEEEVEEYTPGGSGGGDDEVIDYTPGNK